jgi:hypothetical protein
MHVAEVVADTVVVVCPAGVVIVVVFPVAVLRPVVLCGAGQLPDLQGEV